METLFNNFKKQPESLLTEFSLFIDDMYKVIYSNSGAKWIIDKLTPEELTKMAEYKDGFIDIIKSSHIYQNFNSFNCNRKTSLYSDHTIKNYLDLINNMEKLYIGINYNDKTNRGLILQIKDIIKASN